MDTSLIVGITVGTTLLVLVIVFVSLVRSGAFGMSKAKQRQAMQLMQTGHKARALIVAIQPTGMVVNHINIQCVVHFQLQPLHGGAPFAAQKQMLLAQTSMPRIGDMWPCWYDPADPTQFAVGQPSMITPEQIAIFREFGIPHPLDQQQR